MGKKAQQRRARRNGDRDGQRAVRDLSRAARHVGQHFGDQRHCVDATALLSVTAELLGHRVTRRAVALAAQHGENSIVLGERAAAAWPGLEIREAFVDGGWNGAGHVIATLEEPPYLFDPTLQQIDAQLDVDPFVLATPVESSQPASGPWDFHGGGLGLRYYLLPEDDTWAAGYGRARAACRETAGDLAGIVRSGADGIIERI